MSRSAATCVAAPAIHIVKTADAAQVNAGEQIGFTMTVWNAGTGDAHGVTLDGHAADECGSELVDRAQGAGWSWHVLDHGGGADLRPGDGAGRHDAGGSTFTVHITSTTTAATGGVCAESSGLVDNTGHVTTTNDGSDESTRRRSVSRRRRSRS